jgi:hypothetical protein
MIDRTGSSPLTQPLETTAAPLVRDSRAGAGHPQMVLRIGYGLPVGPGAPPRPVSDVIDGPLPPGTKGPREAF